jgi:hypothetical protein
MMEASPISVKHLDAAGNVVTSRQLNPREIPAGIEMRNPRSLAGSVAANEVLNNGGTIRDALDAAIKARQAEREEPPILPDNPELEDMIRYIHAIARLHSGRFEDLTPQGMFEVAMLCPYPIESFESWREKMNVLRKPNG